MPAGTVTRRSFVESILIVSLGPRPQEAGGQLWHWVPSGVTATGAQTVDPTGSRTPARYSARHRVSRDRDRP
jgi:hypothetical protein